MKIRQFFEFENFKNLGEIKKCTWNCLYYLSKIKKIIIKFKAVKVFNQQRISKELEA